MGEKRKYYYICIDMTFYLKADNEIIAKIEAMSKIKNEMVHGARLKIKEVELPDDLKELYFGKKDDKP